MKTIINTILYLLSTSFKWNVYIDLSKASTDRGSKATLEVFQALAPAEVNLYEAVFNLQNNKNTGPFVRCIHQTETDNAFEVSNCDSVEKVKGVLVKLGLEDQISENAFECLKWKYRGNAHLENNNIAAAINSYSKAMEYCYEPEQGNILILRSSAYLQRAFNHRQKMKELIASLVKSVPDPRSLQTLYSIINDHVCFANVILPEIMKQCKFENSKFRRLQFQHGLYEYSLLLASKDALMATQLLPKSSKAWARAGDCFAELRKLGESAKYYEQAIELDPTLKISLQPTIERLRKSQQFLDRARANGWSEDSLRIALDIAG